MLAPVDYIDLGRKFALVREDGDLEDYAYKNYVFDPDQGILTNGYTWEQLLKRRLVVILGEPGSGKSYELQAQASLGSQQAPRFYMRLDELATLGSEIRLRNEDSASLTAWKGSISRAVFFLDSVDEAKIQQNADFHRAIDRFTDLIGARAMLRANVVISSRITEWLPTIDAHEVRMRIPNLEKEDKAEEPYPFVVSLLPLDESGIKTYVTARQASHAESFLEALERTHSWEFARRPADVNDLLAYWKEKKNLGTLTEILDFTCDRQLIKASDRDRWDLLSLERARSGAEYLAAATLFCRKFIFQIPGEIHFSLNAIDASRCLPSDWRKEEIQTLLTRPIFDGASYGHIRFHHRRLSEFLAFKWLKNLMEQGCPVDVLEDLLFDTRGLEPVLRPSLAPLAAWLAAGVNQWNIVVFRCILETAPEILLRYSDPAQLSSENKRALLKALVQKAEGRERLWWEHEKATLSRLADDSLSEDINTLLTTPSNGREIQELALEIVIAGKLTGCTNVVLTIAIKDLEKGDIFPTASRALTLTATESELRSLAAAADEIKLLPRRVCMPLCKLLFPGIWGAKELFRTFSRLRFSTQGVIGWDYTLSQYLPTVTYKENGLSLLRGLLGYPVDDNDNEEDYEPPWSLKTALAISEVLLDWPTVSEAEATAIAEVIVRISDHRPSVERDDSLPGRTERHPKVREQYFRIAADSLEKDHEQAASHLSCVQIYYDRIRPVAADLDWLLKWAAAATSPADFKRAIEWSLEVWHQTGRSSSKFAEIKRLANSSANTREILKRFCPNLLFRAKAFWHIRIQPKFRPYRRRMALKKVKKPFLKIREQYNLWRYRNKLRSGEYVNWLVHLIDDARHETHDKWTPTDWSPLEKKMGRRCVEAAKEGCFQVWKRYTPDLPHEKNPSGNTTHGCIAGLAGIMAAWQDGRLIFSDLPFSDAQRATKYALQEMNGFPPWFDDLTSAQPQAVQSILAECIAAEWQTSTGLELYHIAINYLAWSNSRATALMKPQIYELLTDKEPQNFFILYNAIKILFSAPLSSEDELTRLIQNKAHSIASTSPGFPTWMALWLEFDAINALDALDSHLPNSIDPTELMISVSASLSSRYDDHVPLSANPSWVHPIAMLRFIPLVYQYIRREEDTNRSSGGAYNVTTRDDAQDFRGALLDRLVATDHPDVCQTLQALLADPLLSHLQDYIKYLLNKSRQKFADISPWHTTDMREFATEYERQPRSDSDLFEIGIRRLSDIKRWVEFGEDSPREEVRHEDNETSFRRWLQRRLNESSRGRYSVPQEWEIDQSLRPDLRLVIPDAAPVSMELKIADNWTFQGLINGLEDQLVGSYLRDHRARYGIYVLALFNRDRKWDSLNGGPRINCEQMLAILRQKSKEILQNRLGVSGLEILLIHFSPPVR